MIAAFEANLLYKNKVRIMKMKKKLEEIYCESTLKHVSLQYFSNENASNKICLMFSSSAPKNTYLRVQ